MFCLHCTFLNIITILKHPFKVVYTWNKSVTRYEWFFTCQKWNPEQSLFWCKIYNKFCGFPQFVDWSWSSCCTFFVRFCTFIHILCITKFYFMCLIFNESIFINLRSYSHPIYWFCYFSSCNSEESTNFQYFQKGLEKKKVDKNDFIQWTLASICFYCCDLLNTTCWRNAPYILDLNTCKSQLIKVFLKENRWSLF